MNRIHKMIRREHGFASDHTYDFALRRLCVAKEDSWRGIQPSNYSPDYNPEPPIFSAKFANCESYRHILAIANEDGKIALQDTTKRNHEAEEQSLSAQQCHYNAVFDLEWSPGQMRLVSASGDHTARLWEVTKTGIRGLNDYLGHTRSVKTAAFRRNDSAVFATGGRDGAILIWDTRAKLNVDLQPRADNCIYSGHVGGPSTPMSQRKHRTRTPKITPNTTSSSITGLAFQDSNTLISCGAGDGIIKVWDLRRNYTTYKKEPLPRHSLSYAGSSTFKGFTNLIIDAAGSRLYANCMDNTIYCYNLCSYSSKPLACYKGLMNSTFYIKSCLSPDGKYLLSGSSDETAYIWNLNYPSEPLVALGGQTVEVTCVAWGATHDRPIVTCSDDARHKIWRIGPEHLSDTELAEQYRGHAEYVRRFDKKTHRSMHKYNLRELESTPRSLKRFMEQNERTPSSMEKVTAKRSFLDMLDVTIHGCDDVNMNEGQQLKRAKLESRGRRLFGPCTSHSVKLSTIAEEPLSARELTHDILLSNPQTPIAAQAASNRENSLVLGMPCVVNTKIPQLSTSPSPLRENISHHIYISPPTTSILTVAGASAATVSVHSQPFANFIYSPTSNLPNYVLDGDAPHLGIMSPKRKMKEKVDWLTKIRKQKLMSNCRSAVTLCEKIPDDRPELASPRLQSLRQSENGSRLVTTPRRRISHTDCHTQSHLRTPPSSRRHSETTILRFFSVQRLSGNVNGSNIAHPIDVANVDVDEIQSLSPTSTIPSRAQSSRTPTTAATSCGK